MKTILIISMIVVCIGCSSSDEKNGISYYYLLYGNQSNHFDTIKFSEFNKIDTADSLIAKDYFELNNQFHLITAYTSDDHAATDGGVFYYTLDSIGIIYHRSTTWRNFILLHSNNDSINKLISICLGRILIKPELKCYQCPSK